MEKVLSAEIFKLVKKKSFLGILVVGVFPALYALGIYFQWTFIAIKGQIDMIAFIETMWTLLMMLGLPLIYFAFLGAAILGGEIQDGQTLLYVNKVQNRNSIVLGKAFAMLLQILLCFLVNLIVSCIFYVIFVQHSAHGQSGITLESYHITMMLSNASSIVFLLAITYLSMFFSVDLGVFRATIFSLCVYAAIKFLGNIHVIDKWVPGYYTVNDNANITAINLAYQYLFLVLIIIMLFLATCIRFKRKQF